MIYNLKNERTDVEVETKKEKWVVVENNWKVLEFHGNLEPRTHLSLKLKFLEFTST